MQALSAPLTKMGGFFTAQHNYCIKSTTLLSMIFCSYFLISAFCTQFYSAFCTILHIEKHYFLCYIIDTKRWYRCTGKLLEAQTKDPPTGRQKMCIPKNQSVNEVRSSKQNWKSQIKLESKKPIVLDWLPSEGSRKSDEPNDEPLSREMFRHIRGFPLMGNDERRGGCLGMDFDKKGRVTYRRKRG